MEVAQEATEATARGKLDDVCLVGFYLVGGFISSVLKGCVGVSGVWCVF